MNDLALDEAANLIGSVLFDNSIMEACAEVRPEHFREPAHGAVWAAIQTRVASGRLAEPIVINAAMGDDEAYAELGGLRFLCECIDVAAPMAASAHAEVLIAAAKRRGMFQLGDKLKALAGQGTDADLVLAEAERALAELSRQGGKPLAVPAGLNALDMVEEAYAGGFTGTPTGIAALDRVTGGIRTEDVWFIGGRTSMGKSVLGLGLARGLAEQGRGVLVFSLEMPMRECQARLIADIAHDPQHYGHDVRYGDILKGRGSPDQRDRARRAARRLASLPISIADAGGLTINDIRVQASRQMRAWERAGVKPGAVMIDHIGLVRAHTDRGGSKPAETADIVNELKALAKALGSPVVALCQVSRNTESRNDKRPTLADLNWSGAIEQIADLICLLYRESYYLERSGEAEDQHRAVMLEHDLDLLIPKNRSGPACNVKAWIDVSCNAVRDRAEPERVRA